MGQPPHQGPLPSVPGPVTCVVCRRMLGRHLVNWWGDRWCDGHPTCDSCGRPMADTDVRASPPVCPTCRHEAVTIRDEAIRAALRVQRWMQGLGFDISLTSFPLRFVEGDRPARSLTSGTTHMVEHTSGRGIRTRSVSLVEIVRGLTVTNYSGIVAHELTHAWLFLSHIDLGDQRTEEGAAELVRCLYLAAHDSPEASYRRSLLEANPDAVYGDGYRLVAARWQGGSLPDFLRSLDRRGPAAHAPGVR